MKISGFTIIKNAVINDYPMVESIRSILPVVDEMIVLVGDCADETRSLVASIGDPKIKIFDSVWDKSLKTGGQVLALETDKAFARIAPDSTWAFYLQADEVVHEQYLPAIRAACLQYEHDKQVEGLLFRYLHFYGTFDYVGDSRKWYHREVRIIRNDPDIKAYRDAQGFRKHNHKLRVKLIDACIYHYGWVKSPAQMRKKLLETGQYWDATSEGYKPEIHAREVFNYDDFDSLQRFEGTHPLVMKQRVEQQHWDVQIDIHQKRFSPKDRLLYWFEKKTGIRLFDYKNYKLV